MKEIRAGINAFTLIEKELKETNIPLKETYINKALRLVNKTMSEDLIRAWIKKCRPQLECEQPDRKEFENHIKKVERELKNKKKMEFPDVQISNERLFPHEFLFLLCNCKNRIEAITKLQKPEFTTERKSIKKYEMQ